MWRYRLMNANYPNRRVLHPCRPITDASWSLLLRHFRLVLMRIGSLEANSTLEATVVLGASFSGSWVTANWDLQMRTIRI